MGFLGTDMEQWSTHSLYCQNCSDSGHWFLLAVFLLVIDFTNGRNSIVWKDDKNPEQQKECNIHHFWETMYPYH